MDKVLQGHTSLHEKNFVSIRGSLRRPHMAFYKASQRALEFVFKGLTAEPMTIPEN
jgi:hypothetical protein